MLTLTSLATIFISSFVIALSGALMPGPLLTATISESSQRGFITGPLMIAGHAILELGLVIVLLLGLAPFFQLPVVFVASALAGAVILLWMAFGMFRKLPTLSLSLESKQTKLNHPMISGIVMSVSNPYWIIWWATIGIGYIFYSWHFGLWGIVFFTGHILADLAWYSFISAAVAGNRNVFDGPLYRVLIALCCFWLFLPLISPSRDLKNFTRSSHQICFDQLKDLLIGRNVRHGMSVMQNERIRPCRSALRRKPAQFEQLDFLPYNFRTRCSGSGRPINSKSSFVQYSRKASAFSVRLQNFSIQFTN